MKIVLQHTREELEEIVREENRERMQAPAKVRNARAFASIGEHRAFRWAEHYYRVPPVPFSAGADLFVLRSVLADGDGSIAKRNHAVLEIRRVLFGLIEHRRRDFGLNPFRRVMLPKLNEIIGWFLDVPDESPFIVSPSRATVDLIDGVMEYLRAGFPHKDGLPWSWAHYNYALRHIGRARARESLRMQAAVRMAQPQAQPDKVNQWLQENNAAAGGWD